MYALVYVLGGTRCARPIRTMSVGMVVTPTLDAVAPQPGLATESARFVYKCGGRLVYKLLPAAEATATRDCCGAIGGRPASALAPRRLPRARETTAEAVRGVADDTTPICFTDANILPGGSEFNRMCL